MLQNIVGCSAEPVAHTVMPAGSSMGHQTLHHCSSGDLHSMVTLLLVCTIYTVVAETDALAISKIKKNLKFILILVYNMKGF